MKLVKLLLIVLSCTFACRAQNSSLGKEGWALTKNVKVFQGQHYYISTEIFFNGKLIPIEFERIVVPFGEFKRTPMFRSPGAPRSWVLINKDKKIKCSVHDEISQKSDGKNWLKSAFIANKSTAWFYSVTYGYWINPTKVEDFIGEIEAGNITLPSKE